jgi:hypothetical protein
MKWGFFILLIFSLFSCSEISRTPSSTESLHVVLDIDWTIVSNYEKEFSNTPQEKIIMVEGRPYVARDHLSTLIEYLLKNDIKVSFFSGGGESRNRELLSKIYLDDGRSLAEIATTVKSFEDLTKMPNVAEDAKFSEKYKKDLLKISDNLDNVILFDDAKNFYLNEAQKENLIHLGPSFKYFETFEEAQKVSGDYIPKNYGEWLFDRQKFLILKYQVEEALKLHINTGVSFKKAMNMVLAKIDLASGNFNLYTSKLKKPINLASKKVISSRPCSENILPFFNL